MISEKQIQKGKEILLKYMNESPLKGQYDGMTSWELSKLVLEAGRDVANEEDAEQNLKERCEELQAQKASHDCDNPRHCSICFGIEQELKALNRQYV